MKKILLIVMAFAIGGWTLPKPMESIENYNVLMVHGAYGHEKGFSADTNLSEAYTFGTMLENGATLGAYDNNKRITKWFSKNAFEEADIDKKRNATNSFVYNWRSFSNPANTSLNNAYELGYRMWNKDKTFGKRRALVEEAQEVKAKIYNQRVVGDSVVVDSTVGQNALEIIRKNPDLYHQLASRYILVGHSMGGVVSREYVQGDFYNSDVDKIIFKKFCIGA